MTIQSEKILNGDQALAFGALAAGVKLVSSYPGSPSSGTVETLIEFAKEHNFHVEWSSNEKVAIEMGIGASIAGRRAMVCAKSVGMNLMVDPLMVLNLTPVRAGIVILLGDDPGAYGSQNDQDTRLISPLLEIPMLEPASPAEGYIMAREAFDLSEKFHTPLVIRITRSYTQQFESIAVPESLHQAVNLGFEKEPWRFVPVPKNAVTKHQELHKRLQAFEEWTEGSPFNKITGSGKYGIIGVGFAYQKLLDIVGQDFDDNFQLYKLSTSYPLPKDKIANFLRECDQVLVIEENEPFIETQIKVIAHDFGLQPKIFGKKSGHVSREGELFRWQIQQSLLKYLPEFEPAQSYLQENEQNEIPRKESFCSNAGYSRVLDALEAAAKSLDQDLILVGDPGCLVTVAERLDAKYAIGSAVAVADGMSKAGVQERPVALFGDSAFFHTSIPAICNAAHNQSDILMVVLDNNSTASTGNQPHPGMNKDAMGFDSPKLSIEQIARSCGVTQVKSVDFEKIDSELQNVFQETLKIRKFALVIVHTSPP